MSQGKSSSITFCLITSVVGHWTSVRQGQDANDVSICLICIITINNNRDHQLTSLTRCKRCIITPSNTHDQIKLTSFTCYKYQHSLFCSSDDCARLICMIISKVQNTLALSKTTFCPQISLKQLLSS